MNRKATIRRFRLAWPLLALFALPAATLAQVAVPEFEELEEIPTISAGEIDELVGPIALYPDDLLAIVLPAATYPLQIVEAGRFLEALEDDPGLEPDENWDDSVVALLNYPEVVALMNEDLDWTWRLGEAVVGQQSDVIGAIESFRDRAYAAGNLESDDYQLVSHEGDTIQITPVQDDVIYVPYYEPEEVIVYQPRTVYYYYPRPYPVYYYPYPSYYSFHNHFHRSWFWGVTTAFTIGWHTHHLNVHHHSFYSHPYYGYSYRDNWWYRRPDIHVYNNTYVRPNVTVTYNRYTHGDRWAPTERRTVRRSDGRVTRTRYYADNGVQRSASSNTRSGARTFTSSNGDRDVRRVEERGPIQFRDRAVARPSPAATSRITRQSTTPRSTVVTRPSEPRVVTPDTQRRESTASRGSSQPRESSAASNSSQRRESSAANNSSQRRESSASRGSSQPRQSTASRSSSQRRDSNASRSASPPRESSASRSASQRRESSGSRSASQRTSQSKPSNSRPSQRSGSNNSRRER